MQKQKISVVIPNWNGQDLLCQCIDSLLNQSLASTIIVVENGTSKRYGKLSKI